MGSRRSNRVVAWVSLVGPLLGVAAHAAGQAQNPGAAPKPVTPAAPATPPPAADAPANPLAPTPTPPATQTDPLTVNLSGFAEQTFRSDLRNAPGHASITRAGADLGLAYDFGDGWKADFTVSPEFNFYSIKDATTIVPGTSRLFHELDRLDLTPAASYQLSDQWRLRAGALLEFAGAPGVNAGDSFMGGGFASASYSFSKDFSLLGGLAVISRLEDSPSVYPVAGIFWQISPKVRMEPIPLGEQLDVKLSDSWDFTLGVTYQPRDFRLASDNTLPSGVMRDRRVPIDMAFDWKPCDHFVLGLHGGAVVWQEYTVDDQNGNRVSQTDSKPAAFVGIRGEIKF